MIGYLKNRYYLYKINNIYRNNCSKKAFIIKARSMNKLGNSVDMSARIMGPIF